MGLATRSPCIATYKAWCDLMQRRKKTGSPQPYLIRPRIYLNADLIVGPGKIELLKAVRDTGSISAAARQMRMNYKRAWYLLDTLKQGFHQPVIEAVHGGKGGGGTRLTPLGEQLIIYYTAVMAQLLGAAAATMLCRWLLPAEKL